jgi:hypothetical protein
MKRNVLMAGLLAVILAGSYMVVGGANGVSGAKKELLRVGVYDSRAIAIAYSASRHNDNVMIAKSKEKHQAEQAGDVETAERIEQEMRSLQVKRHLQGFGTAPVHDLLASIEKQVPAIAREAGVDVIVSKWAFDYRAGDAEVVDVTAALVKAFEPTAKALEWIEQMKDIKPMSEAEILQHELEGGL